MNNQPRPVEEALEEIANLELSEQPAAFAKLHDQLEAELNRTDQDDLAQ